MQNRNHLSKITNRILLLAATMVASLLVFVGCRKSFDQPPYNDGDPDITTNATIASVKQAFDNSGSASYTFTDSLVFSGIVVSSDSAGNVFKTLYIEDSTGGINVQIDASNLYSNYPMGMRVFVKMAGLSMNKYGGSYEIGQGFSQSKLVRIPSSVMSTYIIPGSTGHAVAPVVFDKISDITDAYQSMLVQVNNMQFSDVNAYYADSTKAIGYVSNTIANCSGETAVVYTSSYASFAGKKVATGMGSITAIYVPYNSTKELILNDLGGVSNMTGTRCDGSGNSGTISDITGLRNAYSGKDVALTAGTVTGIVVSSSTNESSGNVRVVQEDNAAGILVYAPGTTTYNIGDKVSINLSGSTLTSYNGELELKNSAITVTGTGGSVTPLSTTLDAIVKAGGAWSTRLVKVSGLTVSTSSTSTSGVNYQFSDGANGVLSFVRTTSGITLTPGTATVIGYVSIYKAAAATDTTIQLTIRTANDVTYTGTGNTGETDAINLGTSPLVYDFNDIATGLPGGFYVRTGLSASDSGALGSLKTDATSWSTVSAGFYNYASATGLTAASSVADQSSSTDRALGVRQTGTSDNGVGFVLKLANTTGKNNLTLSFDLQSLDVTSPRTMSWAISYATGSTPNAFTTLDASKITGSMTSGGSTFGVNSISVDLNALSNVSTPVYIRIVATGSTGSGNRPSSAIDNVKFTWQ
ncbi:MULTISPECIES: DUF5689 domain-containing protein [Chitinophagaceae]